MGKKHLLKHGLLTMGLCAASLPAAALDTGIEGVTFDGRLRQGYSVAYDLDGQGNQNGPANYIAEVKSSYTPNRDLTFIGNFWLRGDLSPQWDDIEVKRGGLTNPASPGFRQNFPMFLHRKNCDPDGANPKNKFCASSSELRTLDKAEEVIRELSVKYRDPGNRFSVKFGKFQRGWGQSDGLRLLDILHAQDLRERFAFKDSDELRIPALMLATDFNFTELGMAGPFEALGMRRPTLEFNIVPEVFHSKFIINNPTPTDRSSGGIFGLPWPVLSESKGGFGLVGIGANLREKTPRNISLEDAEYSMRLKFETLGGEGTINLFYGQQDLPVVKLNSADLIVGSAYNNPNAPAVKVPASVYGPVFGITSPLDATMFVGHGVYLPMLRGGLQPLGTGGAICDGVVNPLFALPLGTPCSVTFNFDLDYDYRQKVVGFSFARDLSDTMAFGPKNTSPAIRLEAAYEFSKPFNRSVALMRTPALPFTTIERGSPALTVAPKDAITKSDVLSTMFGFDYPLWIPGWEKQQKSVFTSFQFFNIYTKDADDRLLAQAPYGYTEVEKNQQYTTFLWNAPVMGERLVLDGLLIKDLNSPGYFYRQRVDFQFWGNKWRPRLEWMHFSGDGESAPYGIFKNSDFVEISLTYQF